MQRAWFGVWILSVHTEGNSEKILSSLRVIACIEDLMLVDVYTCIYWDKLKLQPMVDMIMLLFGQ